MKIPSILTIFILTVKVYAYESSYERTSIGEEMIVEQSDVGNRELQIIPTLFKKILELRRKFDNNLDGVIGDFLFGMAPSDSPSMAPSEMPSSAPSDTPSRTPTWIPSAAPFSINDVIGNNQNNNDITICQSDNTETNADTTSTTEMTIMYSYILEIKQNAHLFKTLEKIEVQLQRYLIDSVCGTTMSSTIGVSSTPADIPGATCLLDSKSDDSNLCYVIAGRYKLMIEQDMIGNANSIYCQYLEATRSYFSSENNNHTNITSQISDILSIRSTITDTLLPTFCTYSSSSTTDVSASISDSENTSTKSITSAKIIVPIVIGCFTILVAVIVTSFYIVSSYRTDISNNNNKKINDDNHQVDNANSDFVFDNSDETESQFTVNYIDSTITGSILQQQHSNRNQKIILHQPSQPQSSMHSTTEAIVRGIPPNHLSSTNNSSTVPHSPTHTEQEIVFSPTSSSVATSVLFRSP